MPFLSLNAKALLNWVTSFKVMFQTVSLCIWYNYFKNILVWGVCDFQQQEHEKNVWAKRSKVLSPSTWTYFQCFIITQFGPIPKQKPSEKPLCMASYFLKPLVGSPLKHSYFWDKLRTVFQIHIVGSNKNIHRSMYI